MKTYVVSTINRDGSISKKMFASFKPSYPLDFPHGYHFTNKCAAFDRCREINASRWAEVSHSVGRWVVINTKTMKIVTR